jgi:putative copper export protein
MSRRLKQTAVALVAVGVVLLVAFAAAQLVRPERTIAATDPSLRIQALVGTSSGLVAVLDRACNDCHSNTITSAWYTTVAPVSWVMARGAREGRKAVNFSEWGAYPPERQRALLLASCMDVSTGKMPMRAYIRLRPAARLSALDIATICAAAP